MQRRAGAIPAATQDQTEVVAAWSNSTENGLSRETRRAVNTKSVVVSGQSTAVRREWALGKIG